MRLFLYGTLLDKARLSRLAGRALPLVPARLAGWRRVGLRATPYPTLVRACGTVAGAVVVADAAALRRLSAYEGPRYRQVRLAVRAGDGRVVPAWVWVGDAPTRRPWVIPAGR